MNEYDLSDAVAGALYRNIVIIFLCSEKAIWDTNASPRHRWLYKGLPTYMLGGLNNWNIY